MREFGELGRLLDFMERNIDLDHLAEIEQLQYDAIKYRDIERLPLSIRTEHDGFTQVPYEAAFNDPEKMLYNEILCSTVNSCYNSVRLKDDGPLMIRSNHGTGIIPSLFGCKTYIGGGRTQGVSQISIDEAKKRFNRGVPELNQGLAKQVIETYKYFHEKLRPYPKCCKGIHITQPDMQGPYDTLHHIIGNDAFILPFDEPEAAKNMIDIIAETYIAFRRLLDPYLTDGINGDAVFVHGLCAGGKVLIKADVAIANLSPESYQKYEGEPDMRIMKAFEKQGGGSLFYCGGSKKWHNHNVLNGYLRCIHYGNPEMHDLKAEYACFKKNKVAIAGWGYNQEYQFIRKTILTGDGGAPVKTGLTLTCLANSIKQSKEIIARHKEVCCTNMTNYF
jgi:hypothetical protein